MSKSRTFAVFGLGTFGFEICKELYKQGATVIAVDRDPAIIDRIKNFTKEAVVIDSTIKESIETLSTDTIDIAIVAIAEDVESSIITTALLKQLKIPTVIARATTEIHRTVLQQIGADEIINVEIEQGKRLANRLISPTVFEQIQISDGNIFADIALPEKFIGKNLIEIDLRRKYHINLIFIKRSNIVLDELGNPHKKEETIIPEPNEIFLENDRIQIIGDLESIKKIKEL